MLDKKNMVAMRTRNASYSRRSFLKTTMGSLALAGLIGCDTTEDPFESYSGPEINEIDLISTNTSYYDSTINLQTLFPNASIINGSLANATDPVAIAYRLQYLIDLGDTVGAETILDNLLLAQEDTISFINYRGFIPPLIFSTNSDGFEKDSSTFSIAENAVLSARVAMAASAFAGTAIEEKAMTFLQNQKEGYNFYLSDGSLFFPVFGDALSDTIDSTKIDLLFSDFYTELAFVFSYFIGDSSTIVDPQDGLDAWLALIGESSVPTSQHGDSFTGLINIPVPLSRNGSAYQYFLPLLALSTGSIPMVLQDALYNVMYSYLDAARAANLPGIFSGGPNATGDFLEDNGLIRLTASGSQSSARESVATVDMLVAALRLFPGDSVERQTLRRWIGLYSVVPGIQNVSGFYGSVDRSGTVSESIFARQNAAMILFESTAPDQLETFLAANGKTSLQQMFSQLTINIEGTPIQRIDADLPLPPPEEQIFTSMMM